jgi:hypothetical protein
MLSTCKVFNSQLLLLTPLSKKNNSLNTWHSTYHIYNLQKNVFAQSFNTKRFFHNYNVFVEEDLEPKESFFKSFKNYYVPIKFFVYSSLVNFLLAWIFALRYIEDDIYWFLIPIIFLINNLLFLRVIVWIMPRPLHKDIFTHEQFKFTKTFFKLYYLVTLFFFIIFINISKPSYDIYVVLIDIWYHLGDYRTVLNKIFSLELFKYTPESSLSLSCILLGFGLFFLVYMHFIAVPINILPIIYNFFGLLIFITITFYCTNYALLIALVEILFLFSFNLLRYSLILFEFKKLSKILTIIIVVLFFPFNFIYGFFVISALLCIRQIYYLMVFVVFIL